MLYQDSERHELIGLRLEEARVRLLALVERLGGLLGDHSMPLLDAADKQLMERSCRIAVIGQIKAGKSTFINALAQRPGFLPTDINPWTAVVTALHFRNSPTRPEHAAVFHLFSADEWKELAEGGGRLRELTERLVPGFQPDLLRAQVDVMRKRAEARLGAKFGELLGQCHQFETVTPELLADYVSAGDDRAYAANGRRLYSDITRSADIYINDGPFAYPVTLIDTPGTNDPFLVRDEITRRSLENPDIYVFVISALQPLSAADIYMLRLLNGLHKDRIVVFINRTDQLPNPAIDAPAIKSAVEKRLRLEFPALDIPVVCGSAWLGSMKLQPSGSAQAVPPPLGKAPLPFAGADVTRIGPMHVSSGMREIAAVITKLMASSSIAMLLRQITVCLAELVRSAEVTDRAELQSIRELLEARRHEWATRQAAMTEEQRSLVAFEQRANQLEESFAGIKTHFNDLITSATHILHSRLCTIVRDFAEGEAVTMLDILRRDPKQRSWRADVLPLREQMQAAYLASFEQAASDFARVEQFLYPQLKVIVSSLLPDYRGNLLEVPAWSPGARPSIAPLTDKVAVDLGSTWWRQWFAARRDLDERAEHLRHLIESDFLRIAGELVQEAESQLKQRVDYILHRINAISMGLKTGIARRRANLDREYGLLDGPQDDQRLARFEHEQAERAQECMRRQEACSAALRELSYVLDVLDASPAESRLLQ